MKSPVLNLSTAVLALAMTALAQTADPHQHNASAAATPSAGSASNQAAPAAAPNANAASGQAAKPAPKPKTEAQLAFDKIKTLAGEWEGKVTLTPEVPEFKSRSGSGTPILHLTMRVTSRGNTITHEFQEADTPLDWTKYDHPITMIYLDEADRLTLTHYCDAGNRPRMVGKVLADGKTVDFDFVELSGGNKFGHMHDAVFTIIDDNHHVQEWTYMLPGDKPMRAKMELTRVTTTAAK